MNSITGRWFTSASRRSFNDNSAVGSTPMAVERFPPAYSEMSKYDVAKRIQHDNDLNRSCSDILN